MSSVLSRGSRKFEDKFLARVRIKEGSGGISESGSRIKEGRVNERGVDETGRTSCGIGSCN